MKFYGLHLRSICSVAKAISSLINVPPTASNNEAGVVIWDPQELVHLLSNDVSEPPSDNTATAPLKHTNELTRSQLCAEILLFKVCAYMYACLSIDICGVVYEITNKFIVIFGSLQST